MTDSIRYIAPDNSQVKVEPQGWNVPQPCNTYHQDSIIQWEEGRTDEWDAEKLVYDNYVAIMGYDQLMADYITGMDSCQIVYDVCITDEFNNHNNCSIDLIACQSLLSSPKKPAGYYTQEEVDASLTAHTIWENNKVIWENEPENSGQDYPVTESIVLYRPIDLPIVAEPATLIPNIITPYDEYFGWDLAQAKTTKYNEIWAEYNKQTNGIMLTGIVGKNTDKKSTLQKRSDKRLTKKSKGQSLTAQEQTDEDWYDTYLDWVDSNHDVADAACDFVELYGTIDDVTAYNAINMPAWLPWSPPV